MYIYVLCDRYYVQVNKWVHWQCYCGTVITFEYAYKAQDGFVEMVVVAFFKVKQDEQDSHVCFHDRTRNLAYHHPNLIIILNLIVYLNKIILVGRDYVKYLKDKKGCDLKSEWKLIPININ